MLPVMLQKQTLSGLRWFYSKTDRTNLLRILKKIELSIKFNLNM